MKTALLIAATILFSTASHADVYDDYQNSGHRALELVRVQPATDGTVPTEELIAEINTMIGFGWQIMDLYSSKFEGCKDQFAQLKELSIDIGLLSYDQIDELYHDGKGLVKAPKECYRGRSLVVHPYQVIALALENRLVTDAEHVEHEMNEVIVRAGAIRDLLNK